MGVLFNKIGETFAACRDPWKLIIWNANSCELLNCLFFIAGENHELNFFNVRYFLHFVHEFLNEPRTGIPLSFLSTFLVPSYHICDNLKTSANIQSPPKEFRIEISPGKLGRAFQDKTDILLKA